MDVEFVDIL